MEHSDQQALVANFHNIEKSLGLNDSLNLSENRSGEKNLNSIRRAGDNEELSPYSKKLYASIKEVI